jgi:hypothetical protein
MNKKLLENPHIPFSFDNDEECKMLLLELGLSNRLSQNPVGFGNSPAQTVTHLNHPTHWIHAMLFLGKTRPEDNGYMIVCFPKSEMTMLQFGSAIDGIMKGQGQIGTANFIPGDSSDN